MTEMNNSILKLINQNKSMKEICNILNISEKQLYIRIKQIIKDGYNIVPNYRYDSDIDYSLVKGFIKTEKNRVNILMPKNEKQFKCLVISDIHVGDVDSNLKLLNYVYEYACKKNINYILNCGDSIEGDYTSSKKYISDVEKQVEEYLKKYPYDKNIKNIMIFGNHDHHSLKSDGLDISKKISNARYDMIPIGFGQGNVNVKNDNLILFHKLHEGYVPIINNNEKLILSGHGHMMKTKLKDQLWLCIPTLSNVSTDKTTDVVPGFVELTIDLEKGLFEYMEAKHLIITPKIVTVSESRCRLKQLTKLK